MQYVYDDVRCASRFKSCEEWQNGAARQNALCAYKGLKTSTPAQKPHVHCQVEEK